jgi:hypothetical protein
VKEISQINAYIYCLVPLDPFETGVWNADDFFFRPLPIFSNPGAVTLCRNFLPFSFFYEKERVAIYPINPSFWLRDRAKLKETNLFPWTQPTLFFSQSSVVNEKFPRIQKRNSFEKNRNRTYLFCRVDTSTVFTFCLGVWYLLPGFILNYTLYLLGHSNIRL